VEHRLSEVRREGDVEIPSVVVETVEKELKRPNTQAVKIEKPKVPAASSDTAKEAQQETKDQVRDVVTGN
jgi:hypothetical protein